MNACLASLKLAATLAEVFMPSRRELGSPHTSAVTDFVGVGLGVSLHGFAVLQDVVAGQGVELLGEGSFVRLKGVEGLLLLGDFELETGQLVLAGERLFALGGHLAPQTGNLGDRVTAGDRVHVGRCLLGEVHVVKAHGDEEAAAQLQPLGVELRLVSPVSQVGQTAGLLASSGIAGLRFFGLGQ